MNEVQMKAYERMFLGQCVKISPEFYEQFPMFVDNAKVQMSMGSDKSDPFSQMAVAAWKTWVLKSPHPARKIALSAPKNWWEHFKERWFPWWLTNYFPVKYGIPTEYEYGPIYVCPHAKEAWKDNPSLHFQFLDSDRRAGG